KAREGWRTTRPEARREILVKLGKLIEENMQEFARLAALDGGTPLMGGMLGAHLAVEWTKYYAGWADKLEGELLSTFDTRGEFAYTVPEPLGVIGIIITWNGPLISLGMKAIPALAAGNCVVIKPAEITPFAPDLFARLAREAGIPDGVLSMLPGTGEAGQALCENEDVRLISFTGGPITARNTMHVCAAQTNATATELGGESATM